MEYISEVKINEAVIHILDRNGDDVIYNEFYLNLEDEEVIDFVSKHVTKALKDESVKYGKFIKKSIVNEYCNRFFRCEDDLLGASKLIAKRLYEVMKEDTNIPSCDLMVVSILSDLGPLMGIFKMDYIKNYAHKVDVIGDKIGIDIISQFTGLPASSQKVLKCAFIKPFDENEKVNAYVIDKRLGKKIEGFNEDFFIDDFLNCNLERNQRDNTRDFLNMSEKWIRENYMDDAEKSYDIREGIKDKLEKESNIDLDELAEEVIQDEHLRGSFKEKIESSGVSNDIEVDKAFISNKFKRRRIRVDNNIDIYIDEDNYKDSSKFEVQRIGDGRINILIKNVENFIEK
ncbi:MAG: nucleoid-associated protein [Oscillospiraceae bacterium]|nr:nucleoid-associated protein [Oscillospiraceae bacterium]